MKIDSDLFIKIFDRGEIAFLLEKPKCEDGHEKTYKAIVISGNIEEAEEKYISLVDYAKLELNGFNGMQVYGRVNSLDYLRYN
ncbi:hypothetical protein HYW74_01180 [Candidatus Pacearchaeota archaeon]|nr:hypothetical protein [Candidatus Pacearchaeota archaeon]